MRSKRSILIVSAIAAVLIVGLLVIVARHSIAGTWSGSYTGAAAPATVSLILNRNRTGDIMVTPAGTEKTLRWRRRGHQVLLYASDAAPNAPFATGTISDRSDVLNLSVSSEIVDPSRTGGKALIVLAKHAR